MVVKDEIEIEEKKMEVLFNKKKEKKIKLMIYIMVYKTKVFNKFNRNTHSRSVGTNNALLMCQPLMW